MKKMNILFDMETGDPDDLITLLLLLNNPDVNLKGITCFQGSPVQIGLIDHVLEQAGKDIPVGGWNTVEPSALTPYYSDVIGAWKEKKASMTPVEVFSQVMNSEVSVLTGAPLTNLKLVFDNLPDLKVGKMVTQGGFLGNLVHEENRLKKFMGKNAFRTYNLEMDLQAFEAVNESERIESLTYVTKDLCHGFTYTPEIHEKIEFGVSPVARLLKKCLARYAENGKNKAMHDPLAMFMLIYPELGESIPVSMSYYYDNRSLPVFTSIEANSHTKGLIAYDKVACWEKFFSLCQDKTTLKIKP